MWKCNDCGAIFDEPAFEEVDLENLYGVGGSFDDHHWATLASCPECEDGDIEEITDEEAERILSEEEDSEDEEA